MFSGLIKHLGQVVSLTRRQGGWRLLVSCPQDMLTKCSVGDSIAVDGCCLTMFSRRGLIAAFDTSAHTVSSTATLLPGASVHLEPALRAGEPIGGHFVTGHVDGVTTMTAKHAGADSVRLGFAAPAGCERYLVARGSVAISGVSLCVAACADRVFEVHLIPHTMRLTNLGQIAIGEACNFEADCLARYATNAVNARIAALD